LGGVVASRLPKTPLVLAAGATALALLKQKRITPPVPRPVLAFPPAGPPPADIPPQEKVQQWLHQQMHRDTEAAIVELPPPAALPPPPEDKYTPPAFLLDDEEVVSPPLHPDFARLTEPVPHQLPPAPVAATHEPDLPALQALESTESCPTADSGWLLGIDPLPSIGESPAPPVFSAPVFEGRALPDEIEMVASPEPVVHLTPSVPAPAMEIEPPTPMTPPLEEQLESPVQEIAVQMAVPGEASFDPPLVEATLNPWQPPSVPVDSSFAVITPQANPPGSVIEAEIVLRPRAPTQTSVIAKNRPLSQRFAPVHPASSSTIDEAVVPSSAPSLPPAPQVTPREQRARPTWRSWWRGD
jgi:hypothetical protein